MKARRGREASSFELEDAIASFLMDAEYRGSGTGNGARHYRTQLKPLQAFCAGRGLRYLEQVTTDHLREYMRDQKHATFTRRGHPNVLIPLSNQSHRHRYFAMKAFFTWCVDERRLSVSPVGTLKPPKEERRARYAFESDEVERMLRQTATAPGWLKQRDRAIVLMGMGSGARAGEICALRVADIRWNSHQLVLHGKGDKDRPMKMGPKLERALRDWLRVRPAVPFDNVFITQRRTALTVKTLWAMMHNLGRYSGVDHSHTHRLRHTFATEYTRANRDILATSRRLGHEKIKTTEDYLRSLGVEYGLDDSYRTPDEWARG